MKKIAEFFKKKWVRIVLIVLLVLAVVAGGCFLYIYPGDKVARGVKVNGINIGRMSVSDAGTAIETQDSADEVKITLSDQTGAKKEITGLDILLYRDIEKTAEKAHNIGRTGDVYADVLKLVKLAFVPEDIGYTYGFDRDKLQQIIYEFGVSVNGELAEFTLEDEGATVKVSKGAAGQKKDVTAVVEEVSAAISDGIFDVAVIMEKEEPAEATVEELMEFLSVEPVDATYEVVNGEIKITEGVPGRSVNQTEVSEKIEALKNGETITLEAVVTQPKVTKNDLYQKMFKYTLGEFASKYNASNKSRSANVELAARMIDGIVMAPGDVFSYNETLGPRTVQRGFKEAPVYSNGESVMGIGGGICQVSSTLYSAVLYADLEIVERKNHSMTVDYMPKGQDATVSYGTIDFKFKNNTNGPVRISASTANGQVLVTISGSEQQEGKTVTIVNNTIEVKNKTTVEVQDSSLAVGTRKTDTVGKTGYVVDTYRKVTVNGVETKSEYMGRSSYRMVPQKIIVGTGGQNTGGGDVPASVVVTPAPSESEENTESAESVETSDAPEQEEATQSQATETPKTEVEAEAPSKRPEMNTSASEESENAQPDTAEE